MDAADGRDDLRLTIRTRNNHFSDPQKSPDLPQVMALFAPWLDLPPELILHISKDFGLPLESYCRVRRVCTTWRSALPPPFPLLLTLSVADAPTNCLHTFGRGFYLDRSPSVAALLLPAESSFPLGKIPHGGQCVGSSNGWIAAITGRHGPIPHGGQCVGLSNRWMAAIRQTVIFLWNPLASIKMIPLPPLREKHVSKIVFKPNPTLSDHVAVTICGVSRLAYVKERDMMWRIIHITVEMDDRLVDVAYVDDATTDNNGKACYYVTVYGDVRVLRLPNSRRPNPVVESLEIERAGLPFDPAAVYAPPYDRASKFTRFKRIFFVGGNLYQLWRNTTSAVAVSWPMPGGEDRFRMARDDVFVLKYDPERRPGWDKATDLGGYAVFVGKNNPVVMRPEDAAGVKANCVYWIDEWSRNEPMVFDVATGTSTLHPSAAKALSPSCSPVCWYFLNDKVRSVGDNGRKRPTSGEDCGQASKSQKISLDE
ncbi:hypothetical protein QOZ80_4BG0344960 [Eleusine coracana subsp. coracana]|nr:hypothetical protein QOZ80_4BG0344960 [Eleusine coracana subsp. coracana]